MEERASCRYGDSSPRQRKTSRRRSAIGCDRVQARSVGRQRMSGLEVEGGDDRRVVGLGILPVDSEGGGLVVQDLVVDF